MSRVFVYNGDGAREISLDEFCAQADHAAFSWVHADGWREDAHGIVSRCDHMPQAALSALLAQETRPRCT